MISGLVLAGWLMVGATDGAPPAVQDIPAEVLRSRSLYGLAVNAYQAKKFPQARGKLEEALALDPAYESAAVLLGLCCVELGDLPAAADSLTRAVNLRPGDRDLLFLLIQTHRRLQEWGAASDLLDAVEARDGRAPDILRERAEVLLGQQNWQKAEAVLFELKRARPGDAAVRLRLLDLYQTLGAHRRALEEVSELRQLFPRDAGITMRLVQLLLDSGHEDQAVTELEEMTRRHPTHQGARQILVQLYSGSIPNPVRLQLHQARLKELRQPRR